MSFSRATLCCPNHPGTVTPSHVVGIWAELFEQCGHPIGLAPGEQRWEIRSFGRSDPEQMAMAARQGI